MCRTRIRSDNNTNVTFNNHIYESPTTPTKPKQQERLPSFFTIKGHSLDILLPNDIEKCQQYRNDGLCLTQ